MLTKLTKILLGVSVLALAALTAQAVEDGLGTNVVRNIRIQTNGVIDLGGTPITNWAQVGSTANVAQLQADVLAVSNVAAGLNNQSNTWNGAATTAVTANAIATGLNTRSSTWNTAALEATYASNIVVGLNTRSSIWDTAATIAAGLNTQSNIWDNGVIIYKGTNPTPPLVAGHLYYMGGGSVWSNANASTNTTAKGLIGLALGTTVANGLLLNGQYTNINSSFAPGAALYLGTNDCVITNIAPFWTNHVVRIVGYVIDANTIMFNPDRTYIEILAE